MRGALPQPAVPRTILDEYGFPLGALRAPKPWAPEFTGPPDPAFRWSPKFPEFSAKTEIAPSKMTALEEMISRAEATSRQRNENKPQQ